MEENKNDIEQGSTIEISTEEINKQANNISQTDDLNEKDRDTRNRLGNIENELSNEQNNQKSSTPKEKSKKEEKKISVNKRTLLLILSLILIIVIFVLLLIFKIQKLKDQYALPKEENNVFEENVERKDDPDLKYVAAIDDTYSFNDLSYITYQYENGAIKDDNNKIPYDQVYHSFRIIQVSGLKDKNIEKMINDTLLNAGLSLQGTPDSHVNGYEMVMGNFGNILSVQVNYSVGNSDYVYKGYNFNLETGEQIRFEDLFVSSAPIASIISDAVLKSAAWTIDKNNNSSGGGYYSDIANIDFSEAEDIAIKAANYYKELNGNLNFTVSTDGVTIYDMAESILPKNDKMITRHAYIDLSEYRDYVAIYKRFASNKDLYEKKLGNDDAYVFVNMQGLYSMTPEDRYVINQNNYFADIYFISIENDLVSIAKSCLDKSFLNELRANAAQNPNNYYNFSGTVYFGAINKPENIYYEEQYNLERAYLYYSGARYALGLEVASDVLKNINKEKFITALVNVSKLPYASIGMRSISSIEREDEAFFNSLNCESSYAYCTCYYKEDGSFLLRDERIRGNGYVSPYPSAEEMKDFVYKHDPDYSWFFQRRGYEIKYKQDVYDNDPNYYDYYTIINERARMENGEVS